jgi:tRNA1Val (adenine37-N6)-methyltransferase
MANSWFQFKQFTIKQDRSGFKVGTDGVLLGAWADIYGSETALDIGTGTGLLALMLAQRSDAKITAIEIDRASFEQAGENIMDSAWSKRISLIHSPLQKFTARDKFDMIVSNPPFFQDSLRPASGSLGISKHDILLSLDELTVIVPRLMHENSRFCLVLPTRESREFEKLATDKGLFLHRIMKVKPNPDLPVKRHLLEYRLFRTDRVSSDELIIERQRHDYTEKYRELTDEFYLAF